jgi:hypothetical protein
MTVTRQIAARQKYVRRLIVEEFLSRQQWEKGTHCQY